MKPFLYRVADTFYAEYGNELYKHTFVFPNRRAGVFFQKYLMELAGKPIFSPNIITIQELFAELSEYKQADKVALLTVMYQKYVEISGSDESFDDFLYWGEMLLNDFNDVDKHLANARQLFSNIHDLKSLEDDFSYLTKTQSEAINQFWENFKPYEDSESKKEFLAMWKILFELYSAFRAELKTRKWAYEGMLFREVAERAKNKETLPMRFSHIVFVGLNALTHAEIELLRYFKNLDIADFYWDYDSPLIRDTQNRASLWIKNNLRDFPSKFKLQPDEPSTENPQVEVIGIASSVGQTKVVHKILDKWMDEGALNAKQAINTAIVLPDEGLLIPTLYSIPKTIDKINVTMGYGLSHAAIGGLIRDIAKLQHNTRKKDDEDAFYYRDVLSILTHPLLTLSAKDEASAARALIQRNNMVVVAADILHTHPLMQLIFQKITNWKDVNNYLKAVLSTLYKYLTNEKHSDDGLEEAIQSMDLEREFIVQYHKTITRLETSLRDSAIEMQIDTYFRLLNRLAQNINVPFSGEPLSGLQVMGVLETRVIDFENLIILSMNEGVFPLKKPTNSFIPYILRKGFDLPTYEHQDSTYAYHFYRMIYRAKRVALIYDTRTEGLKTGEISRYYYQMKYLYNDFFDIKKRVATYDVSIPENKVVCVKKTPAVMNKLRRYLAGGDRWLSPTAINAYLTCPMEFYLTYVEPLTEEREVQESVEADIFGTIYHHVMETLFSKYKNALITADMLKAMADNDERLSDLIRESFAEHQYKQKGKTVALQGYHAVIADILKNYIKQTLLADLKTTPFTYIDSEYRFRDTHRVSETLEVKIKGSIDRVDLLTDDTYRIIDYKTGYNNVKVRDMAHLFDASLEKRPKEALQVFIYAMMYAKKFPDRKLQPAIYFLRNVFGDFNPSVIVNNNPLTDFSIIANEFEAALNECLSEIFDENVPFTHNPVAKYCSFPDVCGG